MQRHGQVLPPCCCIAGIASGEYICRRFLRDRRGRGGRGEVIDKIGREAHFPRPKSFSCFRASFLKAREAPVKKRKRSETACKLEPKNTCTVKNTCTRSQLLQFQFLCHILRGNNTQRINIRPNTSPPINNAIQCTK